MWNYWLYRILPGIIEAIIVGGIGYAKLWHSKRWPFWGRSEPTEVTVTSEKREDG